MTIVPAPPASSSSSDSGPLPPQGPGLGDLPGWIRPALWFNLVAELGILVTGGLVRVTGSGLGCPTWPQCVPGSFTPVAYQAQGYHKYIEFGNRTLVAVLVAGAVAALLGVRVWARHVADRRRLMILGWTPLALVFVQAVIGGISVRLALTPMSVALHFLPSILLIAASALLIYAYGPDVPPSDRRDLRWLAAGIAVVGTVVITLGTVVTGAGPHSGDADEPVRLPMNPRDVSVIHADAVWLFVGLVVAVALVVRLTDSHRVLRRRVLELLGVTALEGLVGYLQYFLQLPGGLVVLHMLLAGVLTVSITGLVSGVYGTRWITGEPAPRPTELTA